MHINDVKRPSVEETMGGGGCEHKAVGSGEAEQVQGGQSSHRGFISAGSDLLIRSNAPSCASLFASRVDAVASSHFVSFKSSVNKTQQPARARFLTSLVTVILFDTPRCHSFKAGTSFTKIQNVSA